VNPEVVRTDSEFLVKGYLSPIEIPTGVITPRTTAVAIDIVRATTTVNAALARGARAVAVVAKTDETEADGTPLRPGVELACGGERGGQPIPGGLFGNSALDVPTTVAGKDLRFYSSNSGRTIAELVDQLANVADSHLYLASLFNLEVLARQVESTGFSQLVLCASGFYDRLSLEDAVAGGRLLQRLGLEPDVLDDGAIAMVALAERFADDEKLVHAAGRGRVGRTLCRFGRAEDIPAAITGAGLEPKLHLRMRHTIAQLTWLDANTPVFETNTTNQRRGTR
jgi:2-phosphosulfolactate phosphatase